MLIAFGVSGGPGYVTTLVANSAGYESRDQTDENGLGSWTVSFNAKRKVETDILVAFFRVMRGRLFSFPFRDWTDYQVTVDNGVLGPVTPDDSTVYGVGTGFPTYQIYKRYTAVGVPTNFSVYRPIKKPAPENAPLIYKNASAVPDGAGADDQEANLQQGQITFVASVVKNITAISQASSGVVTSAAHGFTNGLVVYLAAIGGMTQLNGTVATVASATTNTFVLSGIDTTGFDTYTSGGTASLFPQPTDALTVACLFDIPVRLDSDFMDADLAIDKARGEYVSMWKSIVLKEVKVAP